MEELNPTKEDCEEFHRYRMLGRWAAASRETAGALRLPLAREALHKSAVVDQSLAWLKERDERLLRNLRRVVAAIPPIDNEEDLTDAVLALQRRVAALDGWAGGPLHEKLRLLRSVASPGYLPHAIEKLLHDYLEEIMRCWKLCRVPQT